MRPEDVAAAEKAAYRAMARFRIAPGERAAFAGEVVAMLAEVPAELLPRGVDARGWGVTAELARRGLYTMRTVASVKLPEVAAAAVSAAAQVMLEEAS